MRYIQKITILLSVLISFSSMAAEIPLQNFYKHSLYLDVKISPDAKYLAVRILSDENISVVVIERKSNKIVKPFNFGKKRNIVDMHWANDERLLFEVREVNGYLQSTGPMALYAANFDGKKSRELFVPSGNSVISIANLVTSDEKHVYVTKYHSEDKGSATLNTLDVYNGKMKLIQDGLKEDVTGYAVNDKGESRLAFHFEQDPDNAELGDWDVYYRHGRTNDWLKMKTEYLGRDAQFFPLGVSPDNKFVYFASDFANETLAMYEYNTINRTIEETFVDPDVDVESIVSAYDGTILGVRYQPDFPEIEMIRPEHSEAKLYQALSDAFPDSEIYLTSYANKGKQAIVQVTSDRVENDFYLLETGTMKISYLMSSRPWLKESQLAKVDSFKIKARDGNDLYGYYALPKGKSTSDKMVVMLHEGPDTVRDRWEFDNDLQFFVNRGYSVLQVNFRGSGGYGKKYQEQGYGEWNGNIPADIEDAIKWAVDKGYGKSGNICAYGVDYGAYAAMHLANSNPDLFKCVIGYIGIYDLETYVSDGGAGLDSATETMWRKRLGIKDEDFKRLSPAYNVANIKADLLIAHGEEDLRASEEHYEILTENLEKHDKPYIGILKEEGHGFSKQKNIYELYGAIEKFLKKNLGN